MKKSKQGPQSLRPSQQQCSCRSNAVLEKGKKVAGYKCMDGAGTTLLQRTFLLPGSAVSPAEAALKHLHLHQLNLKLVRIRMLQKEEPSKRSSMIDGHSQNKTWLSVLTRCCQLAVLSSESAGRPEWHSAEYTVHWPQPPPPPPIPFLPAMRSIHHHPDSLLGHQWRFSGAQILRHFCDQWNF